MKVFAGAATDLCTAVTIVLALGALPPQDVPWPWVAGHAVPGLVLLLGQRWQPRRPLAVIVTAGLTLLGVSALLRAFVPAPTSAPIASVLVAPLFYFALRRTPTDRRYALFLALCVLVIGSVLDGARARTLAVLFAIGATMVLARDTSAASRSALRGWRAPSAAPVRRVLHRIGLTTNCVLAGVSLFLVLSALPVPDRYATVPSSATPAGTRGRLQGLSEQFDLSAADGWLDTVRDLQAPGLAAVHRDDGPTPAELYLRFTHFDLAGANRWATSKSMMYAQPEPDAWTLLTPSVNPGPSYTIERAPVANGHLLLPAGTWRVQQASGIVGNPAVGLLRERTASEDTLTYRAFTLDPDATPPRVDLGARHLLSLPEALMTGDIARLAQSYARDAGDDPMARAMAIARGLRRDYAYTRRDPTGPHPDVLHNFLFHTRAGYCMHFASALAVMLRLQRIPCRIGAGLYGGRPDPDRRGVRVYGGTDAHAWVEVPCLERGFVVLDATPEATRAARGRDAEGEMSEPAARAEADHAATPPSVPLWLLPALFLASLVLVPLLRRPTPVGAERARSPLPAVHPARLQLARLLDNLAAAGLTRRRHDTLARLAIRTGEALDIDARAVADAFTAYEELRFGGAAWDGARAGRMQAGVAATTKARIKPVG